MQESIKPGLISLQEMLKAGSMPDVEMGYQCGNPYACDFIEFCRQSCQSEEEEAEERPANRDQDALDEFLGELGYPLYFMDFETIRPAVPMYDESRSYQQIPFQYSLHVQHTNDGPVDHFEFLGTPPNDPRPVFILSLLSRIGDHGSIIVWNKAFEIGRLREIMRDFPKYADRIEPLSERVADLMVPFRKKYLYTPDMQGSWSLKAVLPALIPDLSYDDLDIQEGGTASMTYESLSCDEDPESIRLKCENLLEYCKLDTLSMVRLLEVLIV